MNFDFNQWDDRPFSAEMAEEIENACAGTEFMAVALDGRGRFACSKTVRGRLAAVAGMFGTYTAPALQGPHLAVVGDDADSIGIYSFGERRQPALGATLRRFAVRS